MKYSLKRGRYVEKPCIEYYLKGQVARFREMGIFDEENMICKTVNAWVSDRFGIVVGIKAS